MATDVFNVIVVLHRTSGCQFSWRHCWTIAAGHLRDAICCPLRFDPRQRPITPISRFTRRSASWRPHCPVSTGGRRSTQCVSQPFTMRLLTQLGPCFSSVHGPTSSSHRRSRTNPPFHHIGYSEPPQPPGTEFVGTVEESLNVDPAREDLVQDYSLGNFGERKTLSMARLRTRWRIWWRSVAKPLAKSLLLLVN